MSGSLGAPGATLTLSAEGTADWAHWGLGAASAFNHKSGVTQQISNYTQIGSVAAGRYTDNLVAFSWSGGTPTASATNATQGIYISGVSNGFQISLPADASQRTLKLYVGAWNAQGRLEASLSDNSAPVYIDSSITDTTGNDGGTAGVYTLNYRAASAGQTLTLRWTVAASYHAQGNVQLQAATLQLVSGPSPTPTNTPTNTATPTPTSVSANFPTTGVLDDFNRSNGAIGGNWSGNPSGYSILGNQLDVGSGDPFILWNAASLGVNQEVFVTFTTIAGSGEEQDLLLKSQSGATWSSGVIEVWYDAAGQRAQVWTYASGQGWVQRGADIPVTLVNGDQFGARATVAGQVQVYRNGVLLATRDVTGWPYYANGGYIGLWHINASNAVLDDFGGGTLSGGNRMGGRALYAPAYAPAQPSSRSSAPKASFLTMLAGFVRGAVNSVHVSALAAPKTSTLSAPPQGQTWKSYYYAGNQLIALRVEGDPVPSKNGVYYLHTDHLGSTSLTTCGNTGGCAGTPLGNEMPGTRQTYYPFGQIRTPGANLLTDKGFTGQRLDTYIKLIQMGARWYDPQIGRWISPDTIVPDPAKPQDLNRFAYVRNNPVTHNDPSGHCADSDEICKAYEQYILDRYGVILQDDTAIWAAQEAELIYETLYNIEIMFADFNRGDGASLVRAAFEGARMVRKKETSSGGAQVPGTLDGQRYIEFPDYKLSNGLWQPGEQGEEWTRHIIAHELGHAWDNKGSLFPGRLSYGLAYDVGGDTSLCFTAALCLSYHTGDELPVGAGATEHAKRNPGEDWAMSFAQVVQPYRFYDVGPKREKFVRVQIALLVTEINQ